MRTCLFVVLSLASPLLFFASCGDSSSSSGGVTPDSGPVTIPPGQDAQVATDSGTDTGNADTGPLYDDAGCPLPTGVVGNLADAGFTTTGLSLWLRADLGVATKDAGDVCRWDDVSGHDRAFVPSFAATPTLEPASLNGKVSVSFPGPDRTMVRNDVLGIPATSGRTIAVFSSNGDTTHRYQSFLQGQITSPGTYFGLDTNVFGTVGSRMGVYVTNNGYDSDLATSTTPHTEILSIDSFTPGGALPGGVIYSVDGTPRTLTRTPVGLGNGTVEDFSPADKTFIGHGVAGFTGGNIGEILVWDHALTASERLAVEQYFQRRF